MTGLVGWWPLHENSGNTARDLSGNGNHGSLNGGVTQGVAGKGGLTGYSFNSSNDEFIDFGTNQDFFPDKISISWWVNYDRVDGTRQYWGIDDDTGMRGWNFAIRSDQQTGKFEFDVVDSNVDGISANNTLSSNTWYHIVGTWDNTSGEGQLFINGALEKTANGSTIENNVDNKMLLGKREYSGNQDNMDAQVSDVRIYNRILSPEEVQELYQWGNGDFARPLDDQNSSSAVSRWAFDGDATDSWNNNDGSNNGVTFVEGIRGQSGQFESSNNDNVETPVTTISNTITVSAWINVNSYNDYAHIVSNYTGSTGWSSSVFGITLNGDSTSWLTNFNGNRLELSNDLTSGWHNLVTTYDGSQMRAYHNGSIEDYQSVSDTSEFNNNDVKIGSDSNPSRYFDGLIDDVRIYDKALSPSEVFELYRWGTRGRDLRKQLVNQR